MSKYEDILKRNEQLLDNVYEMNEEITELANENEVLNMENEELFVDNEALNEQNTEMKKSIAELHRKTSRRVGRPRTTYVEQPIIQKVVEQPIIQKVVEQPQHEVQHVVEHVVEHVVQQPQHVVPQSQKVVQKVAAPPQKVALTIALPDKFKKNMLFGSLIFLILLLGLGIEPGVALNYESILDCFLDLVFNLYKLCILGGIGFILRKLWKNVKF